MSSTSRPHPAARLLPLLVVCAALSACGGGGGDDGGDVDVADDPAPPLPAVVRFGVGTKDAAPLTFTAGIGPAPVAIAYPLLGFSGTWNRTADAYTMAGNTAVNSSPVPPLFGSFNNQIVEALAWVGSRSPTAGKLEQITPAGSPFFLPNPVQSTVTANGVTLTYPGQASLVVDFDTFIALWADDTQPVPWRVASFGGTAMALAVDRVRMALDLMAFVNANDTAISAAGAAGLQTACSPRPGAAAGTRRVALADPDGELNPGDGLVVTYTNCWVDDPTNDIDQLLDGTIRLNNYIENATGARAFVSTGFDELRFESLTMRETETAGGTVSVDPTAIVTTGTLSLFVEP